MNNTVIALLLMILLVVIGGYEVNLNSQTDIIKTENKYIETIDKQQDITYNEVEPGLAKIEENENYMIMEATAYTKSIEEGTHMGITRSGTQVSRGTIAVDPRVIPLGTKVYVEGYGHAECLDTGGAIKGNRIDLYMDSREECFEFGRRDVRVWIVE